MTTKRTALDRRMPPGGITDRALGIFQQILDARSACRCGKFPYGGIFDDDPDGPPHCVPCFRARDLGAELHRELQLKPWDWPPFRQCDGTPADQSQKRWVELRAALIERARM
jgi:hypothetical protein